MRVYVAPRFRNIGDKDNKVLEINGGRTKVRAVSLLANVRESMVRELIIDLPVEKIDEALRKGLKKALSRNKGRSRVTLNVYDAQDKVNAEFVSRSMRSSSPANTVSPLRTSFWSGWARPDCITVSTSNPNLL